MKTLSKELLLFLSDLAVNNNRNWFQERKPVFKAHEQEAKMFFEAIFSKLNTVDTLASYKMMRIYRDVRFSKDKTPYKARFACGFTRATTALRGGYFINIEPENTIVGGGFYGPNSADLHRIRKEFEIDSGEINSILDDSNFVKFFPNGLEGDSLKTAPRGFDKNHPAIDLLRKKQFYVMKFFTDKEVLSPDFSIKVEQTFTALRPFFNYMSEVLTTDLNGESIL